MDCTRRFMDAEINIVAFDDDSDTTLNEKELLIQFLLDFKDWFTDRIYQEYLHGEELDIIRMQDFLRERCCSTEDLSSYAFIMFEYLNLTKQEQKRFSKPRSDCARRFKNIILKDSTPAEFIANTFMFNNDGNTPVIRHEISMKEMLQLYRFLALDKSLSQEYIVAQIREAAAELCNEYGCRHFLYSFLERKFGREKTLQGLIDVGIVQKEDFEKYNVYFCTLLLPFLQTHPCLKILIEWYPEHLRPSDIVRSLQPNEKDGSVLSVDDFKLVFTLAIKHFPQKLGFLRETDKSQNRPRSGMHILDHDFHTSPYEEIYKMQTKREEALDVMKACVNEAGLSLSVDTIENLHVDCRNKITISREREMEIRDNINKRKCQRIHLKTKAGDRCSGERSKMTRDSLTTFSQMNKPQKQFNEYDTDKLKCTETSVTSPKKTCNEILRHENRQDQEIAAALMKNENKINKLVTENSRLRETLIDMNTTLMANDEQINKLVTEASRLEDKLKATEKQHYETKRKITDQLAEAEKKRESEKKYKKRLVLKYETLKDENEKMKKLLNESEILKKDATTKTKPTDDKDLMKENDKLKQKHKECEQNLQELQCAICLEVLKNPHKTKCGHRFCKICIENEIKNAVKYKRKKCCPTCRDPIVSKRDLRKDESFLEGTLDKVLEMFFEYSKTEKEKQSTALAKKIYEF